jgi:uncharacterized membrane protein
MAVRQRNGITARIRLLFCAGAGILAGILLGVMGHAKFAPLVAWDTMAILYVATILASVLRFNASTTKSHALRENPGRTVGDALLLVASLASLFAVVLLIVQAGKVTGAEKIFDVALGLVSVIIAWNVVHTTYLLTYARLYYGDPEGGISFNEQSKPRYADFAYLAFTIGMTFQVSDTDISTKQIRATIIRHALLSYVFGTVIIASTINFLAGLSK